MTRQDILYRSQYSAQIMAQLADSIATNIQNGDICKKDIKDFAILDMILRTLICNVPRKEKLSVGQIEISAALTGSQLATIKVNDVTINNGLLLYGGSLPMFLQDIVDSINVKYSVPNYSAEVVPDTNFINIIAADGSGDSPNGFVIAVTSTLITYNVISNMAGGIDGQDIDDMCLDEDQMLGLFEYFSKKTGLCFNPISQTYGSAAVPVSMTFDSIITDTGDIMVTDVGHGIEGKAS